MIKGLAITPPILGRISIGRVVVKDGKRLPEKDDQFTITSQVQTKDGWVNHPLNEQLRKDSPNGKIRSIPVRMLFNDPDLNLRAEYSMFDRQNGRPLCVGNGETCRRYTESGVETLPCPSPNHCPLAKNNMCKPYGRLNVIIGDDDELGTFIFRTTGYNSIRSLAARLSYYQAVSGDLLSCLPLQLRLRGKSTTQSHRSAIYYVDLTIRDGISIEEAITDAIQLNAHRKACGFDQQALEQAARLGFGNAAFEFSEDEILDIVEEHFPEVEQGSSSETHHSKSFESANILAQHVRPPPITKPSLKDRLESKVAGRGVVVI
jgi:hypothetical protein